MNNAIFSDDPKAIEKLEAKLAGIKDLIRRQKDVNSAHKKFLKDPASLETAKFYDGKDFGTPTKDLIRNYKPAYSWEPHPIAPFWFTNEGANARRIQKRIDELKAKQNESL